MHKVTGGLVLREINYKDADKILTVLTESDGKIIVSAKGTRRRGSKISAAAQLLAFSEMTLFSYKGRFSLDNAETKELFTGLRGDIELLALGSYFAELLDCVSGEGVPEPEILSLGLNSLYALGELKKPPLIVKSAFELRLMCLSGYEPSAQRCSECLSEMPEEPRIRLSDGALHCKKCKVSGEGISMPLCDASLRAFRHIISAEPKRIFSFAIGTKPLNRLAGAVEAYVMTQLERGFKSLDFWKKVGFSDDMEIHE